MKGWVPVQELKSEIGQDAESADEKVKRFLKVQKTCKLLWKVYFTFSFSQDFIHVHILQNFSILTPPDNESKHKN